MTRVKRPIQLRAGERATLAKRVEAIYAFERSNWHRMRGDARRTDSGSQRVRYWSRPGKGSCVWDALADLFHENSICIHTYIHYVFSQPEFIQRPPTPNEIYPHQRLGSFLDFAEAKTRSLGWQFSAYAERLETEAVLLADTNTEDGVAELDSERMNSALLSALLYDSDYIPAIYRYAAGWQLKNVAVREAAFVGAAIEYSRHQKSYDAAWGFLPTDMRQHLLKSMDLILESETGISILGGDPGK